jgi:hypothetical protein
VGYRVTAFVDGHGDEADFGDVESAVARPLARLTGRAGDGVLVCGDEAVEGDDVGGAGFDGGDVDVWFGGLGVGEGSEEELIRVRAKGRVIRVSMKCGSNVASGWRGAERFLAFQVAL